NICYVKLKFTSDCQKHCANCYIFYTGCRYCLTTNVIFGPADQSQCTKCKRITSITNISSRNELIDEFLFNSRLDIYKNLRISDKENVDKYFSPLEKYYSIYLYCGGMAMTTLIMKLMELIPYSQFTNVEKIAEGGFSIIYKATLTQSPYYRERNETVILKRLKNSQDIKKCFLND
ncbi:hypothetical protein C1645_769448, partial [Glomus cerebriforme]